MIDRASQAWTRREWVRRVAAAAFAAPWAHFLVERRTPAFAGEAESSDLLRFLPNCGKSVYEAKGLLREWPAGGPKELWRVEVGWGKSAVVEARGQAFTAAETDDKQWAVCLDPLTGATRWKQLLWPKPNRHFEKGPVTSPVIDGDRVYFIPYAIFEKDVWEMRSPIICLKTDGTELWRADKSFWGTEASTPLVVGDTLYVGADNPQRVVLVALDKMTGKLRWSVSATPEKKNELGAPASLTYQVVEGIPQIIAGTYGTRELLGVHAVSGEVMWRYPYPADIIIGLVSTPVAIGARLFVCGGEGKGRDFSACLEMKAEDGKISCRERYVSTELQTNMYHTASIHEGAVFGFGGGTKAGFLHCTNFDDGRLLWKEESRDWTKEQNLVVADGLIFAVTKNDEIVLAEASRERYRELGRVRPGIEFGRPQQPTIANGRMYLRGARWVVCYKIVP
jgi:outer membrane protein assembly factor BamB